MLTYIIDCISILWILGTFSLLSPVHFAPNIPWEYGMLENLLYHLICYEKFVVVVAIEITLL